MNKRVLAVTASAFALAAMPVVGVFAVDTGTVTDNITITVPETCTLGEVSTKEVTDTVSNGTTKDSLAGNVLSITCNDGTGWHLTAEGAGSGDDKTQLTTGTYTIDTAASAPSESSSSWAFKLNGTGTVADYQKWAAVPSSATTVAKGTTAVSGNGITITYGVGIDADQEAGTYKGAVKYVLAKTAGE